MGNGKIKVVQSSGEPTPKTAAAGKAGVAVTAIVGALSLFGIIIPEEISDQAVIAITAGVSVVTFAAAYFKHDER